MPYDYQLVGGVLIAMFAFVGVANAFVERRSPLAGLIGLCVAGGLIGWAWMLSNGGLTWESLPAAVFRILSNFI